VGLAFYTIGQRKGTRHRRSERRRRGGRGLVCAGKDMAKNELVVVCGREHPLLQSDSLRAATFLGSAAAHADAAPAYAAKTRYRQADAPCRIIRLRDDLLELGFEQPQWAVTPGQSAVLYQGEVCLGVG